ncbi:hypothetical protein [Mycolicibacterium stellerae]|uniref:hypothetical protein n=1 Tax=Mycolicibacterium stellerae TaxID=2358193 RepID=UPI000F0BA667|nr:hypothetical protein [Mycolicibacterium stellerae]
MRTACRLLIVTVLAAALTACQASREAEADPVEFALGQQFPLTAGQEATIAGENLRVRFTDVLEDSRCPTEVECFWTGQARIAIAVQPAGRAATTVDFNTNPAPGQNVQTADVDGYTIALKSLDPYPRTPDDGTAFEDYTATLVVGR